MAVTIKLKIAPSVADCLRPELTAGERIKRIEHAAALEPLNRLMLVFCLMRDRDHAVKAAAQSAFCSLPEETLLCVAGSEDAHPALLDAIAKGHGQRDGIAEALLENGQLSQQARSYLERIVHQRVDAASCSACASSCRPEHTETGKEAETARQGDDGVDALAEEGGEEYLSKYQMAQTMGIAEKMKLALTGDKEWRLILVKDANKLVSSSVIRNPRMTEAEVVALLKSGIQNDDIMRLICANKEWVKVYGIRKALVDNHRTPIQNALRYLATLSEKDIAGYAKSKNVSSVISNQAKRIVLNKKQ